MTGQVQSSCRVEVCRSPPHDAGPAVASARCATSSSPVPVPSRSATPPTRSHRGQTERWSASSRRRSADPICTSTTAICRSATGWPSVTNSSARSWKWGRRCRTCASATACSPRRSPGAGSAPGAPRATRLRVFGACRSSAPACSVEGRPPQLRCPTPTFSSCRFPTASTTRPRCCSPTICRPGGSGLRRPISRRVGRSS